MTAPKLVEHFFRHEYGRLVAMLSHRFGVHDIEAVEDAVQSALMKALETWTVTVLPDNPSGWLFRVSHNILTGELRQRLGHRRLLEQFGDETVRGLDDVPTGATPGETEQDILRMIFVCCEDSIPRDSQLVLALKVLCGFSIREIAIRLFTSEANVYKRLGRARHRLQRFREGLPEISSDQCIDRRPAVHRILYVLFTEGYLSSHAEFAIRNELCEEAIRLTTILSKHPVGQVPETYALLAMMHLHLARATARQDGSGGLLLLEEQDRTRWDKQRIQTGLQWLARSAHGNSFSRYHAEAGVAAEHCLAPSFSETRWDRVIECYEILERTAPSSIHTLNRAVAVAELQGPAAGLAVLAGFEPPVWLGDSYLWTAVMADLHLRCGELEVAHGYQRRALDSAPTPAVRALLARRLGT